MFNIWTFTLVPEREFRLDYFYYKKPQLYVFIRDNLVEMLLLE